MLRLRGVHEPADTIERMLLACARRRERYRIEMGCASGRPRYPTPDQCPNDRDRGAQRQHPIGAPSRRRNPVDDIANEAWQVCERFQGIDFWRPSFAFVYFLFTNYGQT